MPQDLYNLPKGWEWKELSAVGRITTGNTPPKKNPEYYSGEQIPFAKPPDLGKAEPILETTEYLTELGVEKAKPVPKNSILVCCIGSIGKIGIAGRELATNQQINSITFDESVTFKWGYYFSVTLENLMKSMASTAVVSIINKSTFSTIQIPLPPISEQERIVEKLDALCRRIGDASNRLNQILKHSQALFASALDEVFTEIYKVQSCKKLSEVTSKIGSGATPRGGQKAYKESGISLIRSLNVYDAGFRQDKLAFIDDEQASRLDNVTIEENDVLLNITGASIARCCVVPSEFLPARVNQHVCILRPASELDSAYLQRLLISPAFKKDLLFQGAGGATRQALTKTMIQNLKIPLPPLEEQRRIVEHLNGLSERIQTLEKTTRERLNHLAALKASLLDAAFRGNL